MKILKYLFFLILIVVIGGAIYFGTMDGDYDISDSKIIKAPVGVVFNKVNEYKTWENWGPWKSEDPNMTFTYAEKTSGEGASYSWDGDMSGSMTTTKVIPNSEIQQDLTLQTPAGERNPKVYWTFEEVPEGTKVTWGMKGEHPLVDKAYYALSGMDFEAEMHKMNEQGLKGIETAVLADMQKYEINVDGVTQYGGGFYMYATASATMEDISVKISQLMGEVTGYMEENNIPMAGAPFTIYNQIDEAAGTVIFSAGIPTREKVDTPEGSKAISGYMDPITAIKTTLKGDYKNLPEAYAKGAEYIAKNGFVPHPSAKMFEVYPTDPTVVKNPAEWITEIYMPVIENMEEQRSIN